MITDIGGLQRKIDAPGRGIGHIGRHQLLAEQEACARSQFDTGAIAKAYRGAVDDHHVAWAKFKN